MLTNQIAQKLLNNPKTIDQILQEFPLVEEIELRNALQSMFSNSEWHIECTDNYYCVYSLRNVRSKLQESSNSRRQHDSSRYRYVKSSNNSNSSRSFL